ncbi:MAG: hypothetical protein GY870_04100 [archaeon]|nr:hypothetical protein [archaeon]
MISIYLNTFTLIFWLLFNLIINKGDTIITDKKKIIYIVIWAIICSIIFMIPGGVHFENEESIYSAPFAIYGLIIITAIYVFILKVQYGNYNKFDEPSLKKKYRNQIIGIILFMWVLIGTYLSNWFNIPQFRTFFTYTALIIYPAGILLYNGVKKE